MMPTEIEAVPVAVLDVDEDDGERRACEVPGTGPLMTPTRDASSLTRYPM
jgi:hypothetical protein